MNPSAGPAPPKGMDAGMLGIRTTIGTAFLAVGLSLAVGPAHAERSTITGNSGTITLDWEATHDRAGRPLIAGRMITYAGMSGYCNTRLLVETLDAQGQVAARHVDFIPGYVGGFDNVYFELPIRATGAGYRVSVASWDKCGGGQ